MNIVLSERAQMILKIVLFISSVVLIGFLMYVTIFRRPPIITETPETPTDIATGGLQGSPDGTPTQPGQPGQPTTPTTPPGLQPSPVADGGPTQTTQLTTSNIIPLTVVSGNIVTYYDPADGKFYTIDANGNVVALADQNFPQASAVTMNSAGNVAAIEFPDGSNVLFDFTTGKQTTLPRHWEDFQFSQSDKIVSKSIGTDPSNNVLVVSNLDGTQTQPIVALGTNADKVSLNWSPSNNIVGFSRTGDIQSGFGRSEIYLIGTDGKDAGSLIVEGNNFSALWSPNGKNILYSVAEPGTNYRASLWYTEVTGTSRANRKRLDLETWVEKCTFVSATNIYCAVPKEGIDSSGLNPNLVTSGDDLYEINPQTGTRSVVASTVGNTQMFNLSVTADGSALFFTDRQGRLNTMRLR